MPYIPLHHKYRPQTFADLVGQEAIATTLSHAISREQIAPAYLFTGPRGTGKTSSARILAKSLNCLGYQTPTVTPCGKCDVCTQISLGLALDIIEIDAASNTGVDNIREIIERAQFAPVQCRYKVYIIDEVHMLSTAAFNALLKTLEEPPHHVVFVLATTDPQRVLPTITSRCQRYHFRRIPLPAMVEHLGNIAQIETIQLTPGALTLVAQVAQGGLRDAESLLDQLSLLGEEVDEDRVWDLVGAVPERDLLQLLEAIAARSAESILSQIRDLLERGREPLVVLQQLAGFYRDLLIAKTAPNRGDLVAITEVGWHKLVELAKNWHLESIIVGQQHLKSSELQLKQTTQPRLWLEVGVLGLLEPDREGSVEKPKTISAPTSSAPTVKLEPVRVTPTVEMVAPPAAISIPTEKVVAAIQTPVSSQVTVAANEAISPEDYAVVTPIDEAASETASNYDLQAAWTQVIANLQPLATQALLNQHCYLVQFDGESAEIGVKSQPLLKHAQVKLPNIEAAFRQVYQQSVRIILTVGLPASTSSNKTQPVAPPATPAPEMGKVLYTPYANVTPIVQSAIASPSSPPLPAPEINLPTENLEPSLNPTLEPSLNPTLEVEDTQTINAANSLAQFFGGEVVKLTDEISTASGGNLTLTSSLEAVSEDDDVDF
jgi:DNA polymerase III subunit gamma/tau